jgi:hypothetical protein
MILSKKNTRLKQWRKNSENPEFYHKERVFIVWGKSQNSRIILDKLEPCIQ